MKKCDSCKGCGRMVNDLPSACANYVIVGNMNVGKSTIYARMRSIEVPSVNIPGITVAIKRGRIKSQQGMVFDTPGIYSIFSGNQDERASRDILLSPELQGDSNGIIMVADAKNLKRSIAIALQYIEYGLPMLFDINMIDEAISRGIEIDYQKLSEMLGVEVCATIAREGLGVSELIATLPCLCRPQPRMKYPLRVEQFLELVEKLIKPKAVSARALGLLLLSGDQGVEGYIGDNFGRGMLSQVKQLAEKYRQDDPGNMEIALANLYHNEAARIAAEVQTVEAPTKNPFILTLGDWCTQTSTGIPIAMAVLVAMYFFVGSFGATYLVDQINGVIFEGAIIPWTNKFVRLIPSAFVRELIMDPDFGVLPTGVFLAMGLVLPVIFCFYIAFGVLEDSGYLPRISILLDRVFQKIGLNGKGVIPLVMGFSCVTMALLTTRVLTTEKEKNIASFLLFLCMPCAPLIAVMLVILDKMPISARVAVFGIILLQLLVAGFLANKILPGERSPMFLEIPVMRVPKPLAVLKMSAAKTYFFMKEAIPVFIFASAAVFVFQRLGGLGMLEKALGPLIGEVMGLPDKSIQVFIKTMIRRESGAVELQHLSAIYTNLQLVVNLLVMTFVAPCINATIVLFKERGVKAGAVIMIAVTVYAVLLGSLVNHTCRLLGITFT
ncbi:MAG: ferrous iron transporter B [Desulfobulbaceae bacterium]|nr:ferrous iron transporter B [Desulfobulbaceae bacterium]